MKEKKNIEQLFREGFETFEVQPSDRVWKGVRYDLFIRNFMRFSIGSLNAWYVGGALIIASTLAIGFLQPAEKEARATARATATATATARATATASRETGRTESAREKTEVSVETISEPMEPRAEKKEIKASNPQGKKGKAENIPFAITEGPRSNNSNPVMESPGEADVSNLRSADYATRSATALFRSSSREGCVPFGTEFKNYSLNAVKYEWDFGDGGRSALPNPSYVFNNPGTWFVSLTAYSASNEISVYSDSIKVNPGPEARFIMEIQEIRGDGHSVSFYNHSSGADSYHWDFGDGASSQLKDPDHFFSQKTRSGVKLLATTNAGCVDSSIIDNPFTPGEPMLLFPTAFSPSTAGPSSGRYSNTSTVNDVFHPNVTEAPEEYELKIYNRSGILLFESRDILVGWDGYYHEELVPRGVYVWKAEARFPDGRKVVRVGDVTVIW